MVGEIRTRSRGPDHNWIQLGTNNLGTVYWTKAPYQEIVSDQLHQWPLRRTNYLNDVGGFLALAKARYTRGLTGSVSLKGIVGRTYDGSFTDSYFGHPGIPSHLSYLTAGQLDAYGAKGWNRAKPGIGTKANPVPNLGQFLGELRQIPTLPLKLGKHLQTLLTGRKRSKEFLNLGSEYLNVQFGWIPFLSDLWDALSYQQNTQAILAQLKRDNGRPVRRRVTVASTDSTTSVNSSGFLYPQLTSDFYATFPPGSRTVISTTQTKVWFAAAFRYWIPDIDSEAKQNELVRKMLGLRLTPSLVWELTPWSWLIDWFSSIGDVLDNVSGGAAENLTAPYAYVMASQVSKVSVHENANFKVVGSLSVDSELSRETKQRKAASPFGFGLTSLDLSVKQKLILGALGISRSGF